MLVFGDADRREAPAAKLARIRSWLTQDQASPVGIVRHAALVAALVEAGELAQGLADAALTARGDVDGPSEAADRAMDLTLALARCVAASWNGAFAAAGTLPFAEVDALQAVAPPSDLTIRQPEGYAHYCVYPEAYLEAARALGGREVRVIGLRSIGTSLAAIVAAAANTASVVTVRPVGHPFQRELSLDAAMARALSDDASALRAIVDEGPGLSGSSVAAVVTHLERAGVASDAIHLFPSHANGPGPEASPATRDAWARLPSHVVSFDDLALAPSRPHQGLAHWVRDLVGDPVSPLLDISGGAWRALRHDGEANWPPALPWQERRKFLIETESGRFLLKFSGLGRIGLEKLERARRLAEAGFCPEVIGWRHGFGVERWLDDATPLSLTADRPAVLERLGRYIAFRAGAFPSHPERGATLEGLREMALVNTGEALGPHAATRLRERLSGIERWQPRLLPMETDNRLHAWEWLAWRGLYLKTDAVDHHAGHDLIGDQDPAWDIAGAAVEFDLSPTEQNELVTRIEREAPAIQVSEPVLKAMLVLYRTFQLGFYTMAAASCSDEQEGSRLLRAVDRYREPLERDLV